MIQFHRKIEMGRKVGRNNNDRKQDEHMQYEEHTTIQYLGESFFMYHTHTQNITDTKHEK